ncbi:GNAT family N-acetyltransferase [Bdellovibrio bacteriovorus]|uniref:GNAT family N-acetyltransferase n=1 Tax=Bdellovibrio TaxID=958 RepID=UPI0035A980FC
MEGSKIRLRDWRLEDVAPFRRWQKPGMPWQTLDGPYYRSTEDESERLADELKSRIEKADFPTPRMRLVIADRRTNELIGTVSSYWESKETNWLCAGISIFDHAKWGQGIGWEALGLWIDYLFENHPNIVRLDMRTWSGNVGLIHLAKKLGFVREACFRNARIVDGKYFDGLGFGILRSEWYELNPSGFSARIRE